jgi:hypothetical protein
VQPLLEEKNFPNGETMEIFESLTRREKEIFQFCCAGEKTHLNIAIAVHPFRKNSQYTPQEYPEGNSISQSG